MTDDEECDTSLTYRTLEDDPLDTKFEHRPSHDLLSSLHIGLINRWRQTCKTEHQSCHTAAHSQSFPSRVLELLDSGERENGCGVRLVETHGTMREEYACLSYCWGNSETQTQTGETTRANLSKKLRAITIESLPRTIIDAIYLCFQLGFRFLWVDRLCIIQDDARDWEKEASRMCDIYSRSALTITVPSCTHSSQSFLEKRQNAHQFAEKYGFAVIKCIDAKPESTSNLWFFGGAKERASWFLQFTWDEFIFEFSPKGNRWITRGWTFQEWMLSPRVLHIDTMTLWDCFEGYANELNHRYTVRPYLLRNTGEYGKSLPWALIVEEYTRRQITYEKDRLPALAGLASRYRQATGHTYLAGLWVEEMPRSLLWQTLRGHDATPNANETSMPSWSWASLTSAAMYEYEISDIRYKTASFDSYASICAWPDSPSLVSGHEKAWIDIKGHVSVVIDQKMQKVDDHPEGLLYCDVMAGNDYWESIIDYGPEYPEEEIIQSNIHLIVLGSFSYGSELTRRRYGALVLQKCGRDDDPPCFKRLGVAFLGVDDDQVPALDYGHPWELQLVRII